MKHILILILIFIMTVASYASDDESLDDPTQPQDVTKQLPAEILKNILIQGDDWTLKSCNNVCRRWRDVMSSGGNFVIRNKQELESYLALNRRRDFILLEIPLAHYMIDPTMSPDRMAFSWAFMPQKFRMLDLRVTYEHINKLKKNGCILSINIDQEDPLFWDHTTLNFALSSAKRITISGGQAPKNIWGLLPPQVEILNLNPNILYESVNEQGMVFRPKNIRNLWGVITGVVNRFNDVPILTNVFLQNLKHLHVGFYRWNVEEFTAIATLPMLECFKLYDDGSPDYLAAYIYRSTAEAEIVRFPRLKQLSLQMSDEFYLHTVPPLYSLSWFSQLPALLRLKLINVKVGFYESLLNYPMLQKVCIRYRVDSHALPDHTFFKDKAIELDVQSYENK